MFGDTYEQMPWHVLTWWITRTRLMWHVMCYCAIDIFKMYAYTNKDYVDIYFVYEFFDGGAAVTL
jgi:hypothetical protein